VSKRLGRTGLVLLATSVAAGVAAGVSSASAPTPVLGQSAVISRVEGRVSYEPAGSSKFHRLTAAAVSIPFGSAVNAAAGRVQVTIATATAGTDSTALFYSGQFSIAQAPSGIATLTLDGPIACPTGSARIASAHRAKPSSRKLWGDGGSGQYTTSGKYAAATVLGTIWLTSDSCSATSVAVAEGQVTVENLVSPSSQTVSGGTVETVASSGTATTAPFTGAAANGVAVSIAPSNPAPTFGHPYSLTATGTASGAGNVLIYENVGAPCQSNLAAEQAGPGYYFGTKKLNAAGPFSFTARAFARNLGTKYYCAYLTNPVAYAQVVVHVHN
jgi:hypothetical protein